jgi:pimeloyl-ACP methyl ester carboxylesterase
MLAHILCRRLLLVLTAVLVLGGAGAASAAVRAKAAYSVPGPPVVLVTGLDDSTPGMSPGGSCGAVGSMATLCAALQRAGYVVYVVSSSSGSGAVIDNHAAFDANARSLARYLATVVKRPALLVGHSMGGILSRIAISRYGAAAAGLFTIASPHDGSFGADLVEGASGLPCSGLVCAALRAAANLILGHMGAGAVEDLTRTARSADNANLTAPGLPTWTYAGTVCHGPDPSHYYFPNDGIVGESSAFGVSANLGSTARYQSSAFHQQTLETVLHLLCSPFSSTDVELVDSTVIGDVLGAAACVTRGGCHTAADVGAQAARAARRHQRHARTKRIRIVLKLLAAHAETAHPGATVAVSPSTSLLSTTPFSAKCNGQQVAALPALSSGLYGVAPGALHCGQATIVNSSGSGPVSLGVLSSPRDVRARLVSHGKRLRITLSASGPLAGARLTRHGHGVRVRRERQGRRSLTLIVAVKRASRATVSVTVSGQQYVAKIPPLR